MLFLYNFLQLILLFFFWPLLIVYILLRPKYRRRMPLRLGWKLQRTVGSPSNSKKRVWVHALSVGEVSSALPLIQGLRSTMDVELFFSVTTQSGTDLAETIIAPHVDLLLPFPVDVLPIISRFLALVKPDLFILVETDFWPNLLACLARNNIPAILVNGRVSNRSMQVYRKYRFLFRPMFASFATLCMQTAADRRNMIDLGVPEKHVITLGNLKYGLSPTTAEHGKDHKSETGLRIIAGSTHPGEEEILLAVFKRLKRQHEEVSLVIAPRDISRAKAIGQMAASLGLSAAYRSEGHPPHLQELFILDTIGELAEYYMTGDIAFVGGSLVPQGGHNPIEPAGSGVPVLFGNHMEDFAEIADDLLAAGAALVVLDGDNLFDTLQNLLQNPELRSKMGAAAMAAILEKQGVIQNHLKLIETFL